MSTTPLEWAAEHGHLEAVKVLSGNKLCDKAIELAINKSKYDVAEYLISKNNYENDSYLLTLACKSGCYKIVETIINRVEKIAPEALYEASKWGHLNIVELLVFRDADITYKNNAALRKACERGHYSIAVFLVEHGADVHADDDFSIRWASKEGHLQIVQYLVSQGADVHALDDWALRWAKLEGRDSIVKYLSLLK